MATVKDSSPGLFDKLGEQLENANKNLNGTVVVESQQVTGTLAERQEPSLSRRLSNTREGADVQRNLEAAKAGDPTEVDESMDDAVVNRYIDEMLSKFLDEVF